jgi:hypothetical protein
MKIINSNNNIARESKNSLSGEKKTQKNNTARTIHTPVNTSPVKSINKLNPLLQKILIETLFEFNLPIKEDSIKLFIKYINSGPRESKLIARVKAFAILMKNKLPLLPSLINGLAYILDDEVSLSDRLKIIQDFNNNISNNLIINAKLPPEELSTLIKEYPEQMNNIIKLINNYQEKELNEILEHLIGQKLINQEKDNNLLLALEIPVVFHQDKEPLAFYLQIWKEKNRKENKAVRIYKISFIITLEKSGTIMANIMYYSSHIKSSFYSDSEDTINLIKKEFPHFKLRLEELGFHLDELYIEKLENSKDSRVEFINKILPENKKLNKTLEKLIHIDLMA